jgi:hypothetical protein
LLARNNILAGLSARFRMSCGLVEEFLHVWLGLDLAKGTICRCLREVGLACESVAGELLTEIRASELLNLDKSQWYERGALRWLWVVTNATIAIHGTANDAEGKTLGIIVARLKKACLLNQNACNEKAHPLAGEILNNWGAVTAFVKNSDLPPTNNEAERALRHAVISRRISFGTRTDEGSRGYAAMLSVIETCRKRSIIPWKFIAELLAAAREGGARGRYSPPDRTQVAILSLFWTAPASQSLKC